MMRCVIPIALCAGLMLAIGNAAFAAPDIGLKAGTGKAKIDPAPDLFPLFNGAGDAPMLAIHDSLYARALVVDGGGRRAIVIVADLIILPDATYERLVDKISETYGVQRSYIWLTATHCHTVPWTMDKGYEETVTAGIMAAVHEASGSLEPVRVGRGDGEAFININRDEGVGSRFILGQDPEGPSDKTVRVAAFYRKDGSPLAILANYAVHPVSLHSSNTASGRNGGMVSADIPGVTNAFVDDHYGGKVMTFWTSGAAGDQNPILMSYYSEPDSQGHVSASDMNVAGFMVTQRLGESLGREIIRITDRITPQNVIVPMRADQVLIQCPSKANPATSLPLRLSYLGIGPIDLLGVSGEVTTRIDQHMRSRLGQRSPLVLTLTNGYDGYLPDDASYRRGQTFEVGKTAFAAGCTEGSLATGAAALMHKTEPRSKTTQRYRNHKKG